MGLIFLELVHQKECKMYEFLQHEVQFIINGVISIYKPMMV